MFNPSHDEAMRIFGTCPLFTGTGFIYRSFEHHRGDLIYKADRQFFDNHPRQQRFVRVAKGNEFGCAETFYLTRTGERVDAPQLYVLVERRFCGKDQHITAIFRGSNSGIYDVNGYQIVNEPEGNEGNGTVDRVLFQMLNAGGYNIVEMLQYAEIIGVSEFGIADGPIH